MRTATIAVKPTGGYVLVTSGQLNDAWQWYRCGLLELADLRVYFACREMVARRCRGAGGCRFSLAEVTDLTGLKRPGPSVARLEAAGLLRFHEETIDFTPAEGRLHPFPRRMLRFLARCRRPSLIATVLGHLLRCLFFRKGEGCRSGGRCKASWIAEQFGIDLRRVKAARAELIELGWLVRVEEPQWRLNSGGGSYQVNLIWSDSPPPPTGSGAPLPLPDSDDDPPGGSKDQEPPDSGISIRDVQPEDLRDTERTLELHAQAVETGLVTDCEADRLRVVAAAEHALAVATTNAPGLFATILRKRLFGFLTQDDEDAARRRIRETLYPVAERRPDLGTIGAMPSASRPRVQGPLPSDDERVVREVVAAARLAGYRGDPFYLLRQRDPAWTRDRWNAAGGASVAGRSRLVGMVPGTIRDPG